MDATAAPRPAPTAERAARMMRGLEWLMVPIVLALGFMLASFAVRNSDFWMHLATGRLIAEGNYQFGVDPFGYATAGRTWVNHSWLFDLLLWKTYNLNADHSAVVYAKAGLVALLALVLLLAARPSREQAIVPGTKANPTGWLAAILVGFALLAIAPRMNLRPALVSYLFAGITFFVLHHSAHWPGKALPTTLGVLFALWVNLDGWFLLGPAMVALFLAGEAMQGLLPGQGRVDSRRVRSLALTLGISLVACLLNPHHVRAFAVLPAELLLNVPAAMRAEPYWKAQFMSPLDIVYQSRAEFGNSVPGFSYAALWVLGLIAFGMNFRRLRVAQVLTWLACALLSLLNWQLIPFFAVVAAPIAALNFHAFFAARPLRRNVTVGAAEPAVSAGETPRSTTESAEGWWPGASEAAPAAAMTAAAPQPTGIITRGELTLSPETMLDFAGVMGRLLTIVAGVAALALAFPGWLHAASGNPLFQRRVSWDVAPDSAYVQVAERLQKLHRSGDLPADARGLSLSPDVANYMAYYAPDVRTFLDQRFRLQRGLLGDFTQLKRGLADYMNQVETPQDYAEVLRKHGISYIIVTDAEAGGDRLIITLLLNEDQWALWFQNGRTAIFGWHDPLAPHTPDPLRLDLVAMALGSKVERVPPGSSFNVSREPPPEKQPDRTLLDRFLTPPPPEMPPETLAADLYWRLRNLAYQRAVLASQPIFDNAVHAAWVTRFTLPNYFTAFSNNFPMEIASAVVESMARVHPLPTAVEVLAVREARRGVLAHPNQGSPYLMLGMAYSSLPPIGAELRPLQLAVTLHQAVDRLRPDEIQGSRGRMVTMALIELFKIHVKRREFDLAEEALSRALAMYPKHPPLLVAETDIEPQYEYWQRQLDTLSNDMLSQRNKYQLARDQLKRSNAPLHEQVALALSYGLFRDAVRLIEDPSQKLDLPVLMQAAQVYLWMGRIEDAQRIINEVPEQVRDQFSVIQLNIWFAAGEYALAGKRLEEYIAALEREEESRRKLEVIEAALLLQQWPFACVEPAAQSVFLGMVPWALDATGDANRQPRNRLGLLMFSFKLENRRSQKAELLATRAMLALEEGDIKTARKYFKDATELSLRFNSRPVALQYHQVLQRIK